MTKKQKAEIIAQGKKKGLRIQQNLFDKGYCVLLPNGGTYQAKDEKDLLSYIKGY